MRLFYPFMFCANTALAVHWFFMIYAYRDDVYIILSLAHLAVSGLLFFPIFCRVKIPAFDSMNLLIVYVIIGGLAPAYYIVFEQTSRILYLMANRPTEDFFSVSV